MQRLQRERKGVIGFGDGVAACVSAERRRRNADKKGDNVEKSMVRKISEQNAKSGRMGKSLPLGKFLYVHRVRSDGRCTIRRVWSLPFEVDSFSEQSRKHEVQSTGSEEEPSEA